MPHRDEIRVMYGPAMTAVAELWSAEDAGRLSECMRALDAGDLIGALYAIEGAPQDVAAAGRGAIREWATQVTQRLAGDDAAAQVLALRSVLGGEAGVKGDRERYYSPLNSRLSEVIARRRGLPILVSLVWMEVGKAAGLEVQGLGLPGHFIVRVGGEEGVLVDAFAGGRTLSADQCRAMVQGNTRQVEWDDAFLKPASPPSIVERVLRNLLNSYVMENSADMLYRVVRFLCAVRPDLPAFPLQRAVLTEAFGAQDEAARVYDDIMERFPGSAEAMVAAVRRGELPRRRPLLN